MFNMHMLYFFRTEAFQISSCSITHYNNINKTQHFHTDTAYIRTLFLTLTESKSYLILEGRYWCHRFFLWVIFQYLSVALGHELKGGKTRVDPFHPNVTYPLCENWKLILLMTVHDANCFVQCTSQICNIPENTSHICTIIPVDLTLKNEICFVSVDTRSYFLLFIVQVFCKHTRFYLHTHLVQMTTINTEKSNMYFKTNMHTFTVSQIRIENISV